MSSWSTSRLVTSKPLVDASLAHTPTPRSRRLLGHSGELVAQIREQSTVVGRVRQPVAESGIPRATPHDLRRTCLTTITRLGFGRDAMDRIANHKTSTVTDVYDRHGYADEDKRIMAAVARHVIGLVEGQRRAT